MEAVIAPPTTPEVHQKGTPESSSITPRQEPKGPEEAALVAIARDSSDPDAALEKIAGGKSESSLFADVDADTKEKIAKLHDPQVVGSDKYGEGLVNAAHKGKNTVGEHEEAQKNAYEALQGKIDAGLIDPKLIGSEMCLKLGVSPEAESVPQTYAEIATTVNQELKVFQEKGALTEDELAVITGEITEFAALYGKAYGQEDVKKAYTLVRDNGRKLLYQHTVDHDVFSGSDHGLRHIVNGNLRFAGQMMTSLREKGVLVSAKDEVLMHQIMIDHDLGYTTGAAQAPRGFEASKDHPLVSARLIEENKDYYIDRFGQDGYQAIQDSVLNHSYPKLEYQSDGQEVVHAELIRGISSTVDSLGVTVETKTPEFFWNRDAMRTLLKIRLAMETMGGKVPDDLMTQYKSDLMNIASADAISDRQVGYKNAIANFFNEFTADNTLGHFTGVVRNVQVEEVPTVDGEGEDAHDEHGHEGEHKKFRVVVEMTPTEVYAILGNMFGDKLAAQSFVKAAKDLGLEPGQIEAHAREMRSAKSRGEEGKSLEVVSDHARVTVGSVFLEDEGAEQSRDVLGAEKIKALSEVFHEAELVSVRTEINELLDGMQERGVAALPEIQARFEQSVTSKTTSQELHNLNALLLSLSDNTSSGDSAPDGKALTVADLARRQLKGFLTSRERAFLGVS